MCDKKYKAAFRVNESDSRCGADVVTVVSAAPASGGGSEAGS